MKLGKEAILLLSENPKRGEIWRVNFDPTIGSEIKKTRPAIVISSDAVGKLPIKLIAPITDWKEYFADNLWHVKIEPDIQNGLSKISAVDALQLRGMDLQRFVGNNRKRQPRNFRGNFIGDCRRNRILTLYQQHNGFGFDCSIFADRIQLFSRFRFDRNLV